MPIPPRRMRDIKTFTGKAPRRVLKVKDFLQLQNERTRGMRYVAWCGVRLIEERLLEIRKEKRRLTDVARELRNGYSNPPANRTRFTIQGILEKHHAGVTPAEPFFVTVCRDAVDAKQTI